MTEVRAAWNSPLGADVARACSTRRLALSSRARSTARAFPELACASSSSVSTSMERTCPRPRVSQLATHWYWDPCPPAAAAHLDRNLVCIVDCSNRRSMNGVQSPVHAVQRISDSLRTCTVLKMLCRARRRRSSCSLRDLLQWFQLIAAGVSVRCSLCYSEAPPLNTNTSHYLHLHCIQSRLHGLHLLGRHRVCLLRVLQAHVVDGA